MTREKVVEKIVQLLQKQDIFSTYEQTAEEILNLRIDCPVCKGHGNIPHVLRSVINNCIVGGEKLPCPTCNGTGDDKKIFAVLAENQELPVWDVSYGGDFLEGYFKAREDMTSQGWRKVIIDS